MSRVQTHPSTPSAENVTRTVLDNGLIVLVRENFSAPVVVIDGALPCGSLHEGLLSEEDDLKSSQTVTQTPRDNTKRPHWTGLASFTASMLTRGSRNFTRKQFDSAVEDVGASLGAGADVHQTMFGATSLAEDFPAMLNVLGDILQWPKFPKTEASRLRKRRVVHLQERDHDSAQWAAIRFAESLYGQGHPYGYPVAGYAETLETMKASDLAAYHERFYTPNGAIIVVAGAIRAEEAVARVADALGSWQGAANVQTLPAVLPLTAGYEQRVFREGKVQCDVALGTLTPPRHHPDHFAARVANVILGQFGLMGRLGEQLREEMGIVYYVSSHYDAGLGPGVWSATLGTNPEYVPAAVEAVIAEFDRMGSELVSPDELDDAQAYMTGILPVALETNSGVASTLLNMEWQGLGMDYLVNYAARIYEVTREDVRRVVQNYLCNQPLKLTVAGPEVMGSLPLHLLEARS